MTDLVDQVLGSWEPDKRPPTYREFASRIKLPAGPMAGQYYDPASDPVQSWLIDQIDNEHWERICVCAPPQIGGKTQCCILLPALRDVITARSPVGYGLPTLQDLDKAWPEKLKPAIVGSGFSEYLPQKGPGSKGGRGPTLTLQDPENGAPLGRFVFCSGSTYSSTVKTMLVDEVDQFRKANGNPQWGVLEDMAHRADSYGNAARRIYVGTIENDEDSIILVLVFDQGTGTRPWPKCPHCGRHQIFDFKQFIYDSTDEESARNSARIACSHCGAALDEEERQIAIRHSLFVHAGQYVDEAGEIKGPAPTTRTLGLLWTALDASLANLGDLAVEHWRAADAIERRGNHGLMRKFARYRECRLYLDDIDMLDDDTETCSAAYLEKRSRLHGFAAVSIDKGLTYSRHFCEDIPAEVTRSALAADIQGDRIYWSLIGLGDEDRTFDLAWGYEFIGHLDGKLQPFASGDVAHVLGRIAGINMPFEPEIRVTDTGFDPVKGELKQYLRDNKTLWRGIRGDKSLPKTLVASEPDILAWNRAWDVGIGRWVICTSLAHQRIHQMYLRPADAPGAALLPAGLNAMNAYVRHLSAWQFEDGKWKQKSKRDDHLDTRAYATAMLLWTKGKRKHARKYGVAGTNGV